MICIISTFSTFLLAVYGAVVAVKWLIKTFQNNRENILRIVYNTYNLPETTYQKIKINNNRNS
ncbi:MAG: hypothetical protein CML40_09745 [Rhodobacteraceae bacterium]|nr:MAG: hypothetical protein CML40_09745 [Paracoccaceae bacterium]|tara:strand:- start:119 stop:307 length:189 start_codon:yes stop_codon:yes gene_type:complete